MMMDPLQTGRTVGGRYVVRELLHRSSCGDWYKASPSESIRARTLPTEFASSSACVARCQTIIVREVEVSDIPNLDIVGLRHRFLIDVFQADLTTDEAGHNLLVQVASQEPGDTLERMSSSQLQSQWRDLVVSVAAALAHLHALGMYHGAVRYDNIFYSSAWRLGPSRCSGQSDRAGDLRDLAHLIGIDLRRLINDPQQDTLIDKLVDLCFAEGGEAAHVAVCAYAGYVGPAPGSQGNGVSVVTYGDQTSKKLRVSTGMNGRAAIFSCAPHRLPRSGALIPESQLDQLGIVLAMSTSREADMAASGAPVAVCCAVISNGLARIGSHVIIDPPRPWGHLRAMIRPEGLSLQWFWPTDLPCRTMRIQARPDRYPRDRKDPCPINTECHRSVYESAGQCLVPLQQHWNRVFVRMTPDTASAAEDEQAAYATAEPPNSRAETSSWRTVRHAVQRAY